MAVITNNSPLDNALFNHIQEYYDTSILDSDDNDDNVTGVIDIIDGLPSYEDLDVVMEERKIQEKTKGFV